MKVIEIPNSVTDLNEGAFSYCKELESITSKAVIPPTLGKDVFKGVDETIPVYVPKESVDAYKNADGWKEFANIQAQ